MCFKSFGSSVLFFPKVFQKGTFFGFKRVAFLFEATNEMLLLDEQRG